MSVIYSLGIMTGTSCDGADLALLKLQKRGVRWEETLVQSASTRFPPALRRRLRRAQQGHMEIRETAILNRDYSRWVAAFCQKKISDWKTPRTSTVIAVHGQTVWHEPDQAVTVQLVDASIISKATGCTVITGFRQPDLARGGQGAPLVPYYHWLRATFGPYADALPFAIHNVGGIANLTYITKNPNKILAFDTGPGNALIDLAAEKSTRGRQSFDRDGKIAATALLKIDWKRIEALGRHPYFRKRPPKSTGRELFDERFLKKLPGHGPALVANATALTAHTMAKAYANFILSKTNRLEGVFVTGGGSANPTLLRLFSRELARVTRLEIQVCTLPRSFAPPQSLEAMAFARLGLEALQAKPVSLAVVTGATQDAIGAAIHPASNYLRLLKLLDMA